MHRLSNNSSVGTLSFLIMIGEKLILPTRVQAEIDEVALLYAPVLQLILEYV